MIRSPRRTSLAALFVLVASAACSSSASSVPSSASSGPSSSSEEMPSSPAPAVGAIAKSDLGASCALGCTPGVACAAPEPSCPLGYCALDTRPGASSATYCTAACNDNCPEGYDCENVTITKERVCVARHGTCGDGAVQGQESCDDGNAKDFDACSKDCKEGAATYRARFERYTATEAVLPIEGTTDGCGAASVTEAYGFLIIRGTSCDGANDKRMDYVLHIKNEVGSPRILSGDVELKYSSKAHFGAKPVDVMCAETCAAIVRVERAWGSPGGFAASIDTVGLYAGGGGANVRTSFKGTIAIVPPSAL